MEYQFNIMCCFCVLVLVVISMSDAACPLQCACSIHQTDCYGRSLEEIPPDLSNSSYHVDLQSNLIETIQPDRLTRLTNLETLILRSNRLSRLEAGMFVNMTSLKRLHLSDNAIDSVDPDAFINLPSLQVLDLSRNRLTNISSIFVNIPNIERLVLSSNLITELNDAPLSGMEKLQYLVLSRNKISSLSDGVFSHLKLLSYLVLRGNPIKQASKIWTGLDVLSYLDLSDCQLSIIPAGLPWSLNILRLSDNSIKDVSPSDLRGQKYLSVLYINNNQLTAIHYGAFSHSSHLHHVDVSGNRLRQLADTIPANIETFNADNNNIKHIFQNNFDHDSEMKTLSLKNNSISDLAANTFGRLISLTSLYLDTNDIRIMYNMTFLGLRKLQSLSLDSNPVQEIQTRALVGLATLNRLQMSNFNSERIDIKGDFFRDVPALARLDLNESPALVSNVLNMTHALWSLSSVRYLNIMGNDLECLSTDILTALPTLRIVRASGNPWRCDSNLIPLRKWVGKSPRTFVSVRQLKCASPPALEGKSIIEVALSDFVMPTTASTTTPTTNKTTTTTITTSSPTLLKTSTISVATGTSTSAQRVPSSSVSPTIITNAKPSTEYATTKLTPKPTEMASYTTSSQELVSTPSTPSTTVDTWPTTTTEIFQKSPTPYTPSTKSRDKTDFMSRQTIAITTTKAAATSLPTDVTKTSPTTRRSTTTTTNENTSSPKTSRIIVTTPVRTTQASTKQLTTGQQLTTSFLTILTTTVSKMTKESLPTQGFGQTTSPTSTSSPTSRLPSTFTSTKVPIKTPAKTSEKQTISTSTPFSSDSNTSTRLYSTATPSPDVIPYKHTSTQIHHHTETNDKEGGKYAPSVSSSANTDNKSLIIGISAGLLGLAIFIVLIIITVRYHKRKNKAPFVDHDISFSQQKEETSETVCIINHLHDPGTDRDGSRSSSLDFSHCSQHGPGKTSNKKSRKESSTSKHSGKNDDTDVLMDSWS